MLTTNRKTVSAPKVTVIIPNYNHAAFLAKRIESVLGQTYRDFEVLYLDDASTDASAEVARRFEGDPRIRFIDNATNSGSPFKQWNKGVREAKGEYVWIAESDDFAEPTLLETLVEQLDRHPNVGLAYCQSVLVDETDQAFGSAGDWTAHLDAERWDRDFLNDGRDECRRFLLRQCTIPNASAVVFRKSVYDAAGGADEGMRACGDWLLWTNMLLSADVSFVAKPLNAFRKHRQSTSQAAFKGGVMLQENYRIVRQILQRTTPAPADVDLACDGLLSTWLYYFRSPEIMVPWRQHLRICRSAFVTDRHFLRRVASRGLRPSGGLRSG